MENSCFTRRKVESCISYDVLFCTTSSKIPRLCPQLLTEGFPVHELEVKTEEILPPIESPNGQKSAST